MKLRSLAAGLLLSLGMGLPAAAAPIPYDSSHLGLAKAIAVNSSLGLVAGGGGSFQGTVAGSTTAFWCVDSQLNFSFGNSGLANVILLTSVTSSNTQYGNVTNLGTPHWTNLTDLSGDALPTTAAERYAMAAYLISQYDGFNTNVANTARNAAIQQAIWAITNNTTPGVLAGYSALTGSEAGGATSVAYWVDQARQHYAGVDGNGWAVVSWVVSPSGSLSGTPDRQTFLVQVAPIPEPSAALLYGAGLAVAGLGARGRGRR
jgi:hypothetical protein